MDGQGFSVPAKTEVARWRCVDCQKTVFYAATKNGDLLMSICQHTDEETGKRCNCQHKMSRVKSQKLIAEFNQTGAIIDLNKRMVITHGKAQNIDRPPSTPEPKRAAAGGGGNYLDDLYG